MVMLIHRKPEPDIRIGILRIDRLLQVLDHTHVMALGHVDARTHGPGQSSIGRGQRAESRMIASKSDKDAHDNYTAMIARRNKALKLRDDIYAETGEAGRKVLDQAGALIKKNERAGGRGQQVFAAQF